MNTLIYNGKIINPATNVCEIGYLVVSDSKIRALETTNKVLAQNEIEEIKTRYNIDEAVDAGGKLVTPGLIDLHVHFRDPGLTYKEDIETGSNAASHGGFTTVVTMPNTKPVVDNCKTFEYVQEKAKEIGLVNVIQVGSVTKDMAGNELSDIDDMAKAGMIAISEDGKSVMNSGLYRRAMKKAVDNDIIVLAHCEDINLVENGVINKGGKSKSFGVNGISNAVENVITARDIMLSEETGSRLHLCHCSTKESVDMVKVAKEKGLNVTAEVCPHHFILTEDDILSDDAMYKMNPPLRTKEDKEALIEGLRSGIMDVISTDHAPHSMEEKEKSIKDAPFGIVGLETSAQLSYTYLVKKGIIDEMDLVRKMSYKPAQILGIDKGDISVGKDADIMIFDPNKEVTIDANTFYSKGKNTPFNGVKVYGEVVFTMMGGNVTYKA